MVFADRNELISGGNFHGEYPAKVSTHRNSGGGPEIFLPSTP